MTLVMDDRYARAKRKMFEENYAVVEKQLMEVHGDRTGRIIVDGLFPGMATKRKTRAKRVGASVTR